MANIVGVAGSTQNNVARKSLRFKAMAEKWSWDLIADLLGGTKTMRVSGKKWLPQQEAESTTAYDNRLRRSFLFEAYGDTIDKIAARPFKKAVTWTDGADERLEEVFKDVDKTGRHMTQFGYDLFVTGMRWGLTHIFTDFPTIKRNAEDGEQPLSIAEERALGVRPVMVEISPLNLFFWSVAEDKSLQEIRYFENSIVPDGDFGDKESKRIKRVMKDTFEVWELQKVKDKNEESWVELKDLGGKNTAGEIRLSTFYTDQEGDLVARPPLHKLAWMNLTHWQSYSDQRNLLNVARAGVLFGKGFTEDEIDEGVDVGPRSLVFSTNPEANLEWVEHSGDSIKVGQDDIEDIENKMTILGTEPMVITPPKETATGRSIDANNNESSVQAWIRRLEAALNESAAFAAKWLKLELPKDFSFDIFNDFGVVLRSKDDLDFLLKARQTREISQQTFLEEIRRRGTISENIDIIEEMARIEKEGPPLGLIDDFEEDDEPTPDDDDELDEGAIDDTGSMDE